MVINVIYTYCSTQPIYGQELCIAQPHIEINYTHTSCTVKYQNLQKKIDMGIAKTTTMFCLVVFVLISSCLHHARASRSRASIEKEAVMEHCKTYMRRTFPNPFIDHGGQCCQVVRGSGNLQAICNEFTADELAHISLARWAKVTHACGNALPEGSNCAGLFLLIIKYYIDLNSFFLSIFLSPPN